MTKVLARARTDNGLEYRWVEVGAVATSDSDPGAIGAGSLWMIPLDDVFGPGSGFAALFVRNEDDTDWIANAIGALDGDGNLRALITASYVEGGGLGDIVIQTLNANLSTKSLVELNATGVTLQYSGDNDQPQVLLDDTGVHVACNGTFTYNGDEVATVP